MESPSARRLAVLRSQYVEREGGGIVDGAMAMTASTSSSSSSPPDASPSPAARYAPLCILSAVEAVADIKDGDTITVIEGLKGIRES